MTQEDAGSKYWDGVEKRADEREAAERLSTVTTDAHTPTPWCIPVGLSNGSIVCAGDDPTRPGDILFVLRPPFGRGLVPTDFDIDENAAFIVKAVNSHKTLIEALESIANNTCCEGCQEAAKVARAALSQVQP